ncbi:MAG: hypothetical protein DRI57_07570 [Deltaproteobacteria bacterium]|nr:MAG: hypothetical protein DRI57_07570 [Deltaproteobacteria bacterium]
MENSFHKPRMNADESAADSICVYLCSSAVPHTQTSENIWHIGQKFSGTFYYKQDIKPASASLGSIITNILSADRCS